MATSSLRLLTRRPLLTGAAITTIAGAAYWASRPPIMLDSAYSEPAKLLQFPKSMLFSRQLVVTHVEPVNHDTKRITFGMPDNETNISGVPPGGAILTQHTPQGAWFPVFRPYTPISDASEPGVVQLLVKKYPNGRASGFLHSLARGDPLTIRGPLPGYRWQAPQQARQVLFIAGGAGITPIYSLTKGILANPNDKTKIQLVWGVNGTRDIVLGKELEALQAQYPDRLHVTYAVSGPEGKSGSPSLGDEQKYKKGYVTGDTLREAVQRIDSQGGWGDAADKRVFLCGPPAFETAMISKDGALAAVGIAKKEIHRF